MKIKFKRLPFYSVLAASAVPWLNGIADSNAPAYAYNLLLFGIVGMTLAIDRQAQLKASPFSWVFLMLFGFGVATAFILHRFHPLADFLVLVPVTIAYVLFLRNAALTPHELMRQLKVLYSAHVAFIVLELLLFFLGSRAILETLSGGAYRQISFHLLSKLVLDVGNGMPNSLLLQAQAASHLVVSAFLLFHLSSKGSRGRANVVILAALFLLFLLVITNMSLLIFVLAATGAWVVGASLKLRIGVAVAIVAIMVLFLDQVLSIVLYRVYEGGTIDPDMLAYYLHFFTVPIVNLSDAGALQLFFGHGMDTVKLESGEIGAVTIAFVAGIYVIGLLFAWLGYILLAGFRSYQRLRKSPDPAAAPWVSLLFVNLVLCAAWALSTGHYMIILIPGGMHLFAFSLAMIIVINRKLRLARKAVSRTAPATLGAYAPEA